MQQQLLGFHLFSSDLSEFIIYTYILYVLTMWACGVFVYILSYTFIII